MLNIEESVGDLQALLKAPGPLRICRQLGTGTGSPLESFLLVLKPECFGEVSTFRTVLEVVHRCLTEQGVAISAYAFANRPLIEQENLINRIYPILATLACLKEEEPAFLPTMDWLSGCLGDTVSCMSAQSYLEKYGIAPIDLHERSNGRCRKIGAGAYLWEDKDRGVWVIKLRLCEDYFSW